jgi:hypothetical protein
MLALVACVVAACAADGALAQSAFGPIRATARKKSTQVRYAQAGSRVPLASEPNAAAIPPHMINSPGPAMEEYGPAGYPTDVFDGGYASGGYSGEPGYDDGCCNACGGPGCDGMCWDRGGVCSMFGVVCPPGRYYFTADYLYLRANFSEAVAFLDQIDDQQQGVGSDEFHELDFKYESSYRFGGGYRMCGCDEEIRFMFSRLSSYADDVAPSGSFLPYEVSAPPDGETRIHADVDVKSYDLEFAKTIQLGGPMGCGDPCGGMGCGDACGSCGGCPAWDLTWSGGLRFADVGWNRTYTAVDEDEFVTTNAVSVMDFRGGGLRLGLEGRRYFFPNGCMSVYLKGDLSVLLGDVDVQAVRVTDDPSTPDPDTINTQSFETRQIIPVTEIETGLTGHITCNTSVTTGYIFSAWHDLGFRDEFNFPTLMETHYDDANILGFDGFFARMEVAY